MTLFQIYIKDIFPGNFQNPLNGFNVTFFWIFGMDKNIIQINNNKDIEFFGQNLNDIALDAFGILVRLKNITLYSK